MQIKHLTREEALIDGARLWLLPTFRFSEWTRRLDWPLNLQILKSIHRKPVELSPHLKEILQENELEETVVPRGGPLMIATDQLLPSEWTVILESDNWDNWRETALKVWKDMGEPPARFFLPSFARWDKVKNQWPKWADHARVQIVDSQG